MIDPATLIPSPHDAPLEPYDEFSRYRGVPLLVYVDAAGTEILYGARRFLPQPEAMAQVSLVAVGERDRLDVIAAQQYGDARWWWRLADANRALDPADLTVRPGRTLRITLPEGVPVARER